jgi:hypothetical protein
VLGSRCLGTSDFEVLCDVVTLIYHEARNVRHLIEKGVVSEENWCYLVSLPKTRNDACSELVPIRSIALAGRSVDRALEATFETRFRVSLSDLANMFANENRHHAKLYGGNSWPKLPGWLSV